MIWDEIFSSFNAAGNKGEQAESISECLLRLKAHSEIHPKLLAWAEAYFSPIRITAAITATSWHAIIQKWKSFADWVTPHIAYLSLPPEESISCFIQSDYLDRCLALRIDTLASDIKLQLLNDLNLLVDIRDELELLELGMTWQDFFFRIEHLDQLKAKVLAIAIQSGSSATTIERLFKRFTALYTANFTAWDQDKLKIDPIRYILKEAGSSPLEATPAILDEVELGKLMENFESVAHPMSAMELSYLRTKYLQLLSYQLEYESLALHELADQAINLGLKLRAKATPHFWDQEEALQLLATLRLSLFRYNRKWPYDVQMLAIMSILLPKKDYRGRIGQISTGEGKSLINIIIVSFISCLGDSVDVITSNQYLAEEYQRQYQAFLNLFGITSSVICSTILDPKLHKADVLFGRISDFEFAYLHDKIYDRGIRGERQFETVIIDEVDNLLIDMAQSAARIGEAATDDITWLYEPLWACCVDSGLFVLPSILRLREKLLVAAKAIDLMTKLEDCVTQLEVLTDAYLSSLLRSAEIAFYKVDNSDYVVRKEGSKQYIEIIDKVNGRPMPGTRWSQGIHEFVEIKEHLPPQKTLSIHAELAHSVFFGFYKRLLGSTGSIGTTVERQEIKKVYQIDTFDVPRHKPNICRYLPPTVSLDSFSHKSALIVAITKEQQRGRPVLVICDSIKASEDLFSFAEGPRKGWMLLNSKQTTDEVEVIRAAGTRGRVTISTNMAGRGTDIILPPESLLAGGLHVIFSFFPPTRREETQGLGRAGRQGQPGSAEMILHYPAISSAPRDGASVITLLRKKQNEAIITSSSQRQLQNIRFQLCYEIYLSYLFSALKSARSALNAATDLSSTDIEVKPHYLNDLCDPLVREEIRIICRQRHAGHAVEKKRLISVYLTLLTRYWARWYSKESQDFHYSARMLFRMLQIVLPKHIAFMHTIRLMAEDEVLMDEWTKAQANYPRWLKAKEHYNNWRHKAEHHRWEKEIYQYQCQANEQKRQQAISAFFAAQEYDRALAKYHEEAAVHEAWNAAALAYERASEAARHREGECERQVKLAIDKMDVLEGGHSRMKQDLVAQVKQLEDASTEVAVRIEKLETEQHQNKARIHQLEMLLVKPGVTFSDLKAYNTLTSVDTTSQPPHLYSTTYAVKSLLTADLLAELTEEADY
jgi:hypothetical protein